MTQFVQSPFECMIKLCRICFLVRNLSRVSLQRVAPFTSSSAASPRFSDFFTDEDGFKETNQSAVYRHALSTQRPSTIAWTPELVNSVSFIGKVDRYPVVYKTRGGEFGCYTMLNAGNARDSNRCFRIQVEMWDDTAKMCIQHLKPDDLIYASGHLESYFKFDGIESQRSRYKVIVNDLRYIAQYNQKQPDCQSPRESQSEACQNFEDADSENCKKSGAETHMGKDKSHLCLWKAFFSSPHDWWDNRKYKKNSLSPDFKHKVTGYTLSLSPNDPPWIKNELQLLDWKMGEQWEEERHKNGLYLWQVFFSNPHEWWDSRRNKKNSRQPDFKHKDTGEALWLSSDDPQWVKRQIQLLDLTMAVQQQEGGAGSRSRVSLWVYDD